jgi:hypothetical protein
VTIKKKTSSRLANSVNVLLYNFVLFLSFCDLHEEKYKRENLNLHSAFTPTCYLHSFLNHFFSPFFILFSFFAQFRRNVKREGILLYRKEMMTKFPLNKNKKTVLLNFIEYFFGLEQTWMIHESNQTFLLEI